MATKFQNIKKPIGVRVLRMVLKTVLMLLLFLVLLILLIQTAPVQNFIRGKAVSWLENKLKTRVQVGKIYIGFPKDVVLENIYLEDQTKDTLLSAGKINANISLFKLLSSKIEINDLVLDNVTAKIKRQLPDTAFNFQFIIDAFVAKDQKPEKPAKTGTANNFTIQSITLNKIRVVYKDTTTGNDVEALLGHLETRISKFDLTHLQFDVPRFKIDGFTARVHQSKPLVKPEPEAKDISDAKEPISTQLNLKELSLEKIFLDYKNDVSSFYTTLDLQKLLLHPDKVDLANRIIDISDFALEGTTASIKLGKTKQAKIVEKETKQEVKGQAESGWKITAASLKLDNNNFKFDNDNSTPIKKGIDYGHFDARDVTLHLDKLFFSGDSISGKLDKGSLKEKSGLNLQNLQTDFTYGKNGAALKDLYLKTPGTELQRAVSIHYASVSALSKDLKNAELDISLQKSKIAVKDVLLFVPSLRSKPAFANAGTTWYINSRIHGRVDDLIIEDLQITGLNNTKVNVTGTLAGLPDINKLKGNLIIGSLQSSRKDIELFIPAKTIPANITVPDNFRLSGTINGSKENFVTNLHLQTNMGEASIKADAKNITDKIKAAYTITIETKQLDLGTILQKKELLRTVSATFTVTGTGLDKKTADAVLNGVIHSAIIKQYNYSDIKLAGSIANQKVNLNAGIVDPNIHLALEARADLAAKYPSLQLHTLIDSIKTLPLHFTAANLVYRGKIDADFPVTNPDSLEGNLYITNSLLLKDQQRIQMDTILLTAGRSDSGQYLSLSSDVAHASLVGRYKVTQLGHIFQKSIEPYFSVRGNDSVKSTDSYDFTVNVKLLDRPVLKALLPGFEKMDSITLAGHFSDNQGWNMELTAPALEIGDNHVRDLRVHAGTGQEALVVNATVNQFSSGKSIILYNTAANASIKDNKIDFGLNIRDKAGKNKYNLAGLFEQPQKETYRFSLHADSLLLNYDPWTISPENKIEFNKESILANNFNLSKSGQQLGINSTSQSAGSPLEINFTNFKLETLTGFFEADSTLIGGTLNGQAIVSDLPNAPVFTGDLTINDLNLRNDTAGNVKLLVNNKVADTYNADITLTGRGNDVHISGNYYAKQADNNFDLLLDLKKLPLATAQALSDGAIRDASGSVNGRFTIKGNLSQPKVNGDLNFVQAVFKPAKLNSSFSIDNEKLMVTEQGIRFDQFAIKDSSGNALTLNGAANTTNFTNYVFDFKVRASNFQALNSTKQDNKLFYGKLFFNTNLNVKGTEVAPVVDGRLTVNEQTKLTVVLPQPDPGVVDREGVVEFVDKDAPMNDSLFLNNYDTLNTFALKGMDISANIDIKKEAELTLIVDEGNGDFINVHGEALLTTSVDPSGKITLAGSYELDDGAYQLTFNLLRRKFNIQKGSKITWGGEPTDADVNITAAYEVSTPPLDLVKNQLGEISATERNTYLQRLPFQVFLKMTGKLLQPQIAFDIVLPDDKEYNVSPGIVSNVRTKLDMLRQETGELNKQVFALLLLNRFVAENPFNSSTSTNAGTLVRQSVSKLLTEQLNRLAENLVQGVDLNFDVQSSDDYTTGDRKDRTDLNVGLSKRLLNDRLTVTVGSNFELEGPQNSNQNSSNIAGNVALNYRLSKDGRYVLRAYRKNEYQGVLDGYIIETGVGFIITVDYNKFREIFKAKKARRPRQQPEQKNKAMKDPAQISAANKSTPR